QSGWFGWRAVAAEELRAIRRERMWPRTHPEEREPTRETPAPGVAREYGPGVLVPLAHDLRRRVIPNRAQNPLGVVSRRQPSGPIAGVPYGQRHDLHWIIGRDEDQQFLLEAVARAGVARVPLAVADGDSRRCPAREWRRRPKLIRCLIA